MASEINNSLRRWWLLITIVMFLAIFYALGFGHYLSFASLKEYRLDLLHWTQANYFKAVAIYLLIYTISVAISVPGAVILTLLGGFLFGSFWGTIYVVLSATLGATLLFIAVQSALADSVANKASKWVNKMREGFQKDAFSYLLTLRLIPLFPFWVVNIVPALLGVELRTYVIATFIGIIPGSAVYVAIGSGLGKTLAHNEAPNLQIIFTPQILIPLIALGFLALAPVVYKKFKNKLKR